MATIKVYNQKEEEIFVYDAKTRNEALQGLFRYWDEQYEYDCNATFRISGDENKYYFSETLFHYCFAKGRLSEDDLLRLSKEMSEKFAA